MGRRLSLFQGPAQLPLGFGRAVQPPVTIWPARKLAELMVPPTHSLKERADATEEYRQLALEQLGLIRQRWTASPLLPLAEYELARAE